MTNKGKGPSTRRKWTRAEYFAHAKNKQAEKWLSDTLFDLDQQSFNRRVNVRFQMKELRESLKPLQWTTGNQEWTQGSPFDELEHKGFKRKTVKFAMDVKLGSNISLPRAKNTTTIRSWPGGRSRSDLGEKPSNSNALSVCDIRPLTAVPKAARQSRRDKGTNDEATKEGQPEEDLVQHLQETLTKNAEELNTESQEDTSNDPMQDSENENNSEYRHQQEVRQKLSNVLELQKARERKSKEAMDKNKKRKLQRQTSCSRDNESLGSTWSREFSINASSDSDPLNDDQYLESELHTVPVIQASDSKGPKSIEKDKVSINSSKNDDISKVSSNTPNENGEDDIDQQILEVMKSEVAEELEKLVEENEADDSRPTSQQADRYNLYSVNYSSLKTMTAKKRIIGRGPLEKPKCVLEKEMAMKIFNRTITTAIANNKFRENAEKSADDTEVVVQKTEEVETQPRRAKSATVPIARFVRAVEAGLDFEHIAGSSRNLRVPFSLARIKRERESMVKKIEPFHLNPEAERVKMKEIESRIHVFLRDLPSYNDIQE